MGSLYLLLGLVWISNDVLAHMYSEIQIILKGSQTFKHHCSLWSQVPISLHYGPIPTKKRGMGYGGHPLLAQHSSPGITKAPVDELGAQERQRHAEAGCSPAAIWPWAQHPQLWALTAHLHSYSSYRTLTSFYFRHSSNPVLLLILYHCLLQWPGDWLPSCYLPFVLLLCMN